MGVPTSYKAIATGVYTVSAGDVTATYSQITCDLVTVVGVQYDIYRAGVQMAGGTMTLPGGANADKFRIATSAGYTLTAGDIIHYIAF